MARPRKSTTNTRKKPTTAAKEPKKAPVEAQNEQKTTVKVAENEPKKELKAAKGLQKGEALKGDPTICTVIGTGKGGKTKLKEGVEYQVSKTVAAALEKKGLATIK